MFGIELSISVENNEEIKIECGNTTKQEKRKFKGKSTNKHVDDYCLLDLETTGIFVNSAKIIEISAIKVRENQVVGEFSTLVNPKCHIPEEATYVNHITDDMVKNAPILESVIDEFLSFVGDDIIVGYNNAGFDMNLIYDSVQDLKGVPFTNDYLDILHASRRSIEGLPNYKLETISKYYMLDTKGEHRALKDCYLTKAVYDNLYKEFGDNAFKKHSSNHNNNKHNGNEKQFTAETIALKELHKNLESMLADDKITDNEVDSLRFWLEEHRDLSGNYPFDKAFNALDNILEDGHITKNEFDELKSIFAEIIDPVKAKGCHDKITTLVGKHVCLTGEFNYGTKNDVAKLIEDVGGIIDKSVKRATDYVIVGEQGSEAWKTGNYGSKIQKAMEWNNKGMKIKIIEETEFIPAIKQLIHNPNECYCNKNEKFTNYDWKTKIENMLDSMIIREELPENSLGLFPNYGRDRNTITSYSVCICEPEYPLPLDAKKDVARSFNVINIKENGNILELMIDKTRFDKVKILNGADIKEIKSDEKYMHVIVPTDHPELVDYIMRNTEYALINYTSKAASFGCCSQFNACSDAKKCIHANKFYSKACIYRSHLEAGRIFYGKNKNID